MQNSDSNFLSVAIGAAAEGLNQSPVFEDVDLFASDRALVDAVAREGASWALDELGEIGRIAGSAHVLDLGRLANENPPKLRPIDQKGRRRDAVEFHPAYHELMALSMRHGLHCGDMGASCVRRHAAPWRACGTGRQALYDVAG